jgi:hypothetical protein
LIQKVLDQTQQKWEHIHMNEIKVIRGFLNHNKFFAPVVDRRGHHGKIPVRITEFVEATSLVPESWGEWFWCTISENAPFSWGDNNRTFVTAEAFADHCENCIMELSTKESTTYGARREWLKKVQRLGQMYIDLEN